MSKKLTSNLPADKNNEARIKKKRKIRDQASEDRSFSKRCKESGQVSSDLKRTSDWNATETAVKEFADKYSLVRKRTVRGQTKKDKAGALPLKVYRKQQELNKLDLMAATGSSGETEESLIKDPNEVEDIVTEVTFVDDSLVAVAVGEVRVWNWLRGWIFW